jgi:hypothetical protein
MLRLRLRSILEALVGSELRSAYRYEGMWHDGGGNVDLVAWRDDDVLTVEAKGIMLSGSGYSASAARKSTSSVAAREAGRDHATTFGWLLPHDRRLTTAGGFVRTLLQTLASDAVPDARMFLISDRGVISEHRIADLGD